MSILKRFCFCKSLMSFILFFDFIISRYWPHRNTVLWFFIFFNAISLPVLSLSNRYLTFSTSSKNPSRCLAALCNAIEFAIASESIGPSIIVRGCDRFTFIMLNIPESLSRLATMFSTPSSSSMYFWPSGSFKRSLSTIPLMSLLNTSEYIFVSLLDVYLCLCDFGSSCLIWNPITLSNGDVFSIYSSLVRGLYAKYFQSFMLIILDFR